MGMGSFVVLTGASGAGKTTIAHSVEMRIAFVKEALAENQISSACIVLLDCDETTRTERLHVHRAQPELANSDMMNWARYLREEAGKADVRVLDTGRLSIAESVSVIIEWLYERHL